ncbi:hypothetical protein QFZ82_001742 [Streptomyces sp. V4I23]|nr:hypothetical protein [Streptomyces sp. V4I23]
MLHPPATDRGNGGPPPRPGRRAASASDVHVARPTHPGQTRHDALLRPPAEPARGVPYHEGPVDTVMLDNAGHYPVEEPGLQQMQDAIADFVTEHTT